MNARFPALVLLAAVSLAKSGDVSAAIACQTPYGVFAIPQFTYLAGVPCTNGYYVGHTVILPPPPPVWVGWPVTQPHFHPGIRHPGMHHHRHDRWRHSGHPWRRPHDRRRGR